ncbi:MAG: endonuclease/exonuclease/phosphatase family protein [Chitinophagaceae bacterium]|nr:endonuclease/exonuclease/phosphatase family protein [Chitinophagaceae bacterium]
MSFLAKFTRRLFIVLNILAAIFFLLACINMYIDPGEWWFIAILGLFFPFMIVVHLFFIIGWLFARSRWTLLSVIVLIIGYSNISALIGTTYNSEYDAVKKPYTIRVLSWNVHQFGFFKNPKTGVALRRQILDYIKEQNPDVLCMQEFVKDRLPGKKLVTVFELMKDIGYPYSFVSEDYIQDKGEFTMGVAIFSKHPFIDSFRIKFKGNISSMSAESLLAVDISIDGKPIRIFTTHLQSNRIGSEEYVHVSSRRGDRDSVLIASKSIAKKLRTAYRFRSEQADKVAAAMDASPHPEIVAGDFNDIPNSYTYFKVRKNRVDAFHEQGWGLGRTFSHISPTLRIDYIIADKRFEVMQFKRRLLPYSDHYPIIADLQMKTE